MLEARELMKSSAFRRIPVVDDIKRVMGIITDGDVGRTSPSDASTYHVMKLIICCHA